MTLRATIAADAITVFTSTHDFAEVVTYYPRAGGSPRSINAVVIREAYQVFAEDGDTGLEVWQVHVANDSLLGIAGTELNRGGDQIAFGPRDGKTAVRKTITQLLTQDHGMLIVECR